MLDQALTARKIKMALTKLHSRALVTRKVRHGMAIFDEFKRSQVLLMSFKGLKTGLRVFKKQGNGLTNILKPLIERRLQLGLSKIKGTASSTAERRSMQKRQSLITLEKVLRTGISNRLQSALSDLIQFTITDACKYFQFRQCLLARATRMKRSCFFRFIQNASKDSVCAFHAEEGPIAR